MFCNVSLLIFGFYSHNTNLSRTKIEHCMYSVMHVAIVCSSLTFAKYAPSKKIEIKIWASIGT